ncbi:MAG: hypothetical protein ABI794_18510, partial [Betaproteobacteria bacterium]
MVAGTTRLSARAVLGAIAAAFALGSTLALAGAQKYEPLSAAVRAQLQRSVADKAAPRLAFEDPFEGQVWLKSMSGRL